ncbi:hypothetical protein GCM10011613_21290 [Cellvibrio zantedeschiae]|uniref:Lipoprotein n=1 Tax=Cellvibrio zantedeschiae TaxID=1237077 RepID=A0ABQ3B2R7_9GAMM|nr:hypothetical protein [Cellvibrio zantedeschiae]GGY76555.1 hypothetical protein GCM10011613_21290 [Cellvibrio zantedeschiae]
MLHRIFKIIFLLPLLSVSCVQNSFGATDIGNPIFPIQYDSHAIKYEKLNGDLIKKVYLENNSTVKEAWVFAKYEKGNKTYYVLNGLFKNSDGMMEEDNYGWGLLISVTAGKCEILGSPSGYESIPQITREEMEEIIKDAIKRAIEVHGDKEFRALLLVKPPENGEMTSLAKKVLSAQGFKYYP